MTCSCRDCVRTERTLQTLKWTVLLLLPLGLLFAAWKLWVSR